MPQNEIQYLYDIAAIPIEIPTLDAVFPHMIKYAEDLFNIEASVLYIDVSRRLRLFEAKGMQDVPLPKYLRDPDDTLPNRNEAQSRPFPHDMPAAGLSLRVGHERLGWLYVARSRDFSEVEARLLAVFAERVAIMLHYANTEDLIRQEREQRKLAHTLQDIGLILTSRRSFEQILEQILAQIARVLPYDAASVWLLQSDGLLHMTYGMGHNKFENDDFAKNVTFDPQTAELVREMMRSKQSIVIPDVTVDDRWTIRPREWIQSWASAPILIQDEYVGQFNVNHTQKNFYGDEHLPILETLTQLISVAAQNANVFDGMRKALAKEKELNDLKTRFISTVSHEFRTPLASILTYNQIIDRYDMKLEQAKRRDYFQKIKGQIQYLNSLVDDVLILGKSDTVGLDFDPNQQGLIDFCKNLAEETSLFAPNNIKLQFDARGDGKDTLYDPKLMRHILFNLLSNAVKYSPDGGTIRFNIECGKRATKIVVADEGIGIPDVDQTKLFTSFFRASNVDELPGTGLGLAIVKRAVDAYGGKIDVQSCANEGTTFTILLPYVSAAVAK